LWAENRRVQDFKEVERVVGHYRSPPPEMLKEEHQPNHPQQVPRAGSRLHHREHPPDSGSAEGRLGEINNGKIL